MRKIRLKKKYLVLLIVLVSISFFFIVLGVSYAFFASRVTSKDYVITTGNLQLNFLKANNEINLTNTYPLSNADGLATEGYSFDITNNGSISTKYQLRLELDPNNTIPIEYIRLSYVKTKENGVNSNNSLSEPVLLSDLNATYSFVKDEVIEPSKTDSYTLKLWIDFSAPNDIQGKTFKAKIAIDSLQNVEDGYVFNSTRPIITLNKFSDGNTDTIIPVNGTFTDPGILSVVDDKDLLTEEDVTITGTVDTTQVGVYNLTYSVTDSDNNTTTVTRTVVVNDGTIPIYESVSEVLTAFTGQTTGKEAIMCSHISATKDLYLDCKIFNTLESAIAYRNKSIIILTQNITKSSTINVGTNKNIILYLSNFNINNTTESTTTGPANVGDATIKNFGNLNIISNGGGILGLSDAIDNESGTLFIDGGIYNKIYISGTTTEVNLNNFSAKCTSDTSDCYSLVFCGDSINASVNNYSASTYGKSLGVCQSNANVVINNSNVSCTNDNCIWFNGSNTLTLNNVKIDSYGYSLKSNKTGIMNINGGTFTSNTTKAIINGSTGIININQTTTPMYITSLAQTWGPAIDNYSTGKINITANNANSCTNSASNTTSGLCVYAEGNKTYSSDTANSAIRNYTSGTININGGTYYGGHQAIQNNGSGNLYIRNAEIISSCKAIINNSNGNIYLCNSNASYDNQYNGNKWDIQNTNASGAVKYDSNTVFTSGNNTPTKRGNGSSNITLDTNITCTSSNS